MAEAEQDRPAIVHPCPRCGAPVACGMANGAARCWCLELPAALPVPANDGGARCYCRSCLVQLSEAARSLQR
jgi:hypothetical protein